MTKTLVTISMAFDMDEDRLPDLVRDMEESIEAGFRQKLEELGLDTEELATFWEEFEYYGAAITLRRTRV
jgi:hypothetical protein